jgi:hypothetical protein
MKSHSISIIILWALVILGFLAGAKVSIDNFNGMACPNILMMPVCYVVTAAYALMLTSLIINNNGCKHYFFCIGWSVAFIIAAFASVVEMFSSSAVCPSTSGGLRAASSAGLPLCYVSLAMLLVIFILFIKGPYQQACHIHNNKLK